MPTRKQNAGLWFSLCAVVIWLAAGTLAHARAENIQALWHLDNSYADASGHGHTLHSDGASFVNAKFEQGLVLNGGVAYTPDPGGAGNLDGFSAITIEAWVKPTSCSGGSQYLVAKKDEAGKTSYYLELSNCQPSIAVEGNPSPGLGGGYEFANSSIKLETGKWTHLAATWDGSTHAIELYINGTLVPNSVAVGSLSETYDTASPVVIGGDYNSSVPEYTQSFNGSLDEVRIWSRALTAAEVMSSAQAGLRADWHFDDNLVDSSGFGNSGTNHGATYVEDTTPNLDDALSFEGTDQFVSVEHSSSLDVTSAYTVEGWVYLDSTASADNYLPIAVRGDASTGENDIEIYCQTAAYNRDLTVVHNRGNGGTFSYAYFAPPPLDTWFHLAVTFDGTTVHVYYDGVSKSTVRDTSSSLDPPLATGKGWLLGKATLGTYGTYYLQGSEDELHLWAIALNGDEIAYLANNSNPAGENGTVGELVVPNEIDQEFTSGAIYTSKWPVGRTAEINYLLLGFIVPDDPGTTVNSIPSTPREGAELLGTPPIGTSELSALFAVERDSPHIGNLHLMIKLSNHKKLRLNIRWPKH